jgi:hypothetical protein
MSKRIPERQEDPVMDYRRARRETAAAVERDEGGDPVCWAHLVWPDCGAMMSEGHRLSCGPGPAGPEPA